MNTNITLHKKIVITGAAGLVGQNLVLLLREKGYTHITVIDKHKKNLGILAQLNPGITIIEADIANLGPWSDAFINCNCAILLHAQITSKTSDDFERNNIIATQNVIAGLKQHQVPHVIHISSSVVNSVANDDYTQTKTRQEQLIQQSGLTCCILRPTLMFGWFDPKHLGWLSRFMAKIPVFPIPGNGLYLRQPLYSRDFCQVIAHTLENQLRNCTYDIVGQEEVFYIDIIRAIKTSKKLRTLLLKIPYTMFYWLMWAYGKVSSKPPFTPDQLVALTAGDHFTGVDVEKEFGIKFTPFNEAIKETFTHPTYSDIILER